MYEHLKGKFKTLLMLWKTLPKYVSVLENTTENFSLKQKAAVCLLDFKVFCIGDFIGQCFTF